MSFSRLRFALLYFFSLFAASAADFERVRAYVEPTNRGRLVKSLRLVDRDGNNFPPYTVTARTPEGKLLDIAKFLDIETELPLWDGDSRLWRQIGVISLNAITITRWEINTAGSLQIQHTTEYVSKIVRENPRGRLVVIRRIPAMETIVRVKSIPYWPTADALGFGLDPHIPREFRKVREAFNSALGSKAPKMTLALKRRFRVRSCEIHVAKSRRRF